MTFLKKMATREWWGGKPILGGLAGNNIKTADNGERVERNSFNLECRGILGEQVFGVKEKLGLDCVVLHSASLKVEMVHIVRWGRSKGRKNCAISVPNGGRILRGSSCTFGRWFTGVVKGLGHVHFWSHVVVRVLRRGKNSKPKGGTKEKGGGTGPY